MKGMEAFGSTKPSTQPPEYSTNMHDFTIVTDVLKSPAVAAAGTKTHFLKQAIAIISHPSSEILGGKYWYADSKINIDANSPRKIKFIPGQVPCYREIKR